MTHPPAPRAWPCFISNPGTGDPLPAAKSSSFPPSGCQPGEADGCEPGRGDGQMYPGAHGHALSARAHAVAGMRTRQGLGSSQNSCPTCRGFSHMLQPRRKLPGPAAQPGRGADERAWARRAPRQHRARPFCYKPLIETSPKGTSAQCPQPSTPYHPGGLWAGTSCPALSPKTKAVPQCRERPRSVGSLRGAREKSSLVPPALGLGAARDGHKPWPGVRHWARAPLQWGQQEGPGPQCCPPTAGGNMSVP